MAKWGRKGASRCSSGALLVLLWASKTRGAPRAEFAAWVRLMHASSGFGWGARGAHVSKLRPSFSLRGMLFQLGASCNFRAASCEPRVLVRKSPLTVCGPSAKFGLSNVWPQWQSAGECALLIARPPKTMSGRKEQSNNSRKLAPLLCCSLQIGIALFAQLGRWFLLGPPSGWLLWSSLKEKRKRGGASCAAQVVLHKLCPRVRVLRCAVASTLLSHDNNKLPCKRPASTLKCSSGRASQPAHWPVAARRH